MPMSEYRIRPHWPRKIVSVYLGVLLVMGCGAVAGQKRQVDVVASIPAILLGGYVVVAVWRNRAEVTAGPKGIRVWFGPMILGERERWICLRIGWPIGYSAPWWRRCRARGGGPLPS